jgi:hypothetical protein
MQQPDYPSLILTGILAQLSEWGAAIRAKEPWATSLYGRAAELRSHGAAYKPAAFVGTGSMTGAEQKACSRAARWLVSTGLVETVVWKDTTRIANIFPTEKGLAVGAKLLRQLGQAPDFDAIEAALRSATWGTPEHVAAIQPKEPA